MQLEILAVYDRAVQAYARPMFLPAVGVGIRSFTDEVNRNSPDNNLFHHPDDFDLFHLGSFDDVTATFKILETPALIVIGKQVKIPI